MAAADTAADDPAADPSVPASPACRSRLSRAVSAATAGRSAAAAELLAEGPCADEPAFLRELAGLRLREGRAGDAIELAGRALAASPDDAHASQTLATALYVNGRPIEALEAWNRVDRPIVDLVRIAGLDRIAHLPVARQLGVAGGDTLTPRALRLAERRLEDVPAVRLSRLRYVPTGGGRVDLVASLVEDAGLPVTPVPLAGTAVRAAIHREITLSASSPFGRGETWSAAWRWWENRPAVRFGFAAPSEFGPPAVWGLSAEWARETYALPGATRGASSELPLAPSERTSVGLSFGQWLSPHARATLRLGYDRREALGGHLRAGLGAEVRVAGDHVRLEAGADRRFSLDGRPGFTAASLRAAAVSRRRPEGLVASVRGHLQAAEAGAPGDLWPGAGVGIARPDLLRAHPLLDDGVVDGAAFDRRLAGGGVELTRWFPAGAAVRVGGAVFLDAAHRWGERPADTFVDAGLGLRLTSAAGGPVVRFDVATGLADDEWAISAGWAAELP